MSESTPTSTPPPSTKRRPLAIALAALVALGTAALFVTQVRDLWFLGDDCFISFRYAKHLVQGHGLVWNPGERVEGYTNFLWVLLMAAGLWRGIQPETFSCVLGIGSGVVLALGVARWLARRHGGLHPVVYFVPLVFATSRSYTGWCTSGLETMFFTLLVWLGFAHFDRPRAAPGGVLRPGPWLSAVFLSLAALTRPEGMLFCGGLGLWLLVDVLSKRHRPRSLVVYAGIVLGLVGGHLLWRHSYYGEWLPNTFYAKVSGTMFEHSLHYFSVFHSIYQIGWFLPLLGVALVWKGDLGLWRMFSMLALYVFYVASVGGDRFEFRFLVVVFPLLYVLLAEGLARLWDARLLPQLEGRALLNKLSVAGMVLAIGGALCVLSWQGSHRRWTEEERDHMAPIAGIQRYASQRIEQGKFLRECIDEGLLPKKLNLCVGGAGALPYYTEWVTVDKRGLNDHKIARLPFDEKKSGAHFRNAPHDYLRERQVEVFDVENRLLHDNDLGAAGGAAHTTREGELPLRAVEVKGRFLVFCTFVEDRRLTRKFAPLEVLGAVVKGRQKRPGQSEVPGHSEEKE